MCRRYFRHSTSFALPSRYEGLPTAVVEAMACGIPVVATAVNAVGDVVVPGETGLLVPPQRPDLMADAVRYLLDRPVVAARMAVIARARLGGRFGYHPFGEPWPRHTSGPLASTARRGIRMYKNKQPCLRVCAWHRREGSA